MNARKKNSRKPKPSPDRKRRLAQKQSSALNFETLEQRNLLAAITVSNNTDLLSSTADTSSITALIANDGGDGISLREAIAATNNTAGEDTITFDASVFTGGENSLVRLTQRLGVGDSLTVDASSVGGVVITGDVDGNDITVLGSGITDASASFTDRLLRDNVTILGTTFAGRTSSLTLTGLTITGGETSGDGGGIDFDSSGTLTLNQSAVIGNRSNDSGGGIFTEDGTIVLNNSTVTGNHSDASINGGGGVYALNGDVSLVNSTVSGNSSTGHGGGIYARSGNVSLINSTVSGNTTLNDSQFIGSGGGIRSSSGIVSLTNSTVSGNSATARGGGISANNFDSDVSLVNSTVSGNSARYGGGLSATSATLVNSTVADNSASVTEGGISVRDLTLQNSIVAGNTDNGTAPNLFFTSAPTNELIVEYSLIGDTTGSGISATTGTGNILNQPALLTPLSDNGGPTLTHALALGSVAIDGGSNALANGAGLTSDQRGEARVLDGTVDIGAVEQSDLVFFVTQLADENDPSDLNLSTVDFNDLSLREAVALTNGNLGGGSIFFNVPGPVGVPQVITVNSQLTITNSVAINGSGANLLTIDAQGGGDNVLDGDGFRIFEVNDSNVNNSIEVFISGLTLSGGDGAASGGAISNFENLTLDGVSIVDNRASFGGGISNELPGALIISNSTIANNEANQGGGGISNGGDLAAANVTISGNSAASNGGAIVTEGGTLNLTHSTISNNTGSEAVYFSSNAGPTSATFNNTIIDGSISGANANGSTLVGGYNLFASDDSGIVDDSGIMGTGNLFNLNPLLGPLADNGGPTLTHALLSGSPAVNSGSSSLSVDENGGSLLTDQRGEIRSRFGAVDIGAIETEFEETRSLVVNINSDFTDPFDGLTSLREAIAFANDSTAGVNGDGDADGDGLESDTISFDESVFTGGNKNLIRLIEGELVIDSSVTIDGSSVGEVVITGDSDGDDITFAGTYLTDVSASFGGITGASDDLLDDNSLVFRLSGSTNDLTLTNLTVTGGDGGIRFSSFFAQDNNLTLNQSTVSGNSTSDDGGGIFFAGNVFLNDSEISGNRSGDNGGGVYSRGDVNLTNSSVSGNSGESGGGIFATGAVLLTDSNVSSNSSGRYGGGIRSSRVELINSQVFGNTAGFDADGSPDRFSNGGGISTFSGGSVVLTSSTVIGNTSGSISGGIHASGNVSLTNSTVSGNASFGDGGGVYAGGGASLVNSTVSGNSSGGNGGGLRFRSGDVSLINSTVSGNSSSGDGGGALFYGTSSSLLANSTVTENSASGAGGGINFGNSVFTLLNSIVAGNTDNGTAPDVEVDANLVDVLVVENSLIGDTNGSGVTATTGGGNILDQLSLLGPLADNGGPTQTHDLLPGSPALNAGSNSLVNAAGATTDQRGQARILSGVVDIGAVEVDFETRLVVTTDQDIEDQTDGVTSLREAIAIANENVVIDTIIFDPSVFDAETTINISSQLPTIIDSLNIIGLGANRLTIDAQGGGDNVIDGDGFRIFEVNNRDSNSSIDVSISGLALTGGDSNDFGGAISNFENLDLDGVSIVNSGAQFGGGIGNDLLGTLTITNSTIANNVASQDGGGVFTRGSLTATNVTISGNSATGSGGAIVVAGSSSGTTLNLTHVTLTNSTGSEGVHFDNGGGPTSATFNNTILDVSVTGVGGSGSTLFGGHNLFASGDPGITGSGNLFNQTAGLGPLTDNGGSTLTHALLFRSPAFNAGNNALALDQNGNQLVFDQRGQRRVQFGSVDIGAVESEFETTRSLVVTTAADVIDPDDGFTSLREAIAFADDPIAGIISDGDADNDGLAQDTITFDASVFTGGDNNLIRLTQGELVINDSLIIDGSLVGGVTITGDANDDDVTIGGTHITDVSASFGGTIGASDDLLDDNSRVISFTPRLGDLTLTGLTVTGGRLNSTSNRLDGSGILFGDRFRFEGTLTLNQSTVSGNSIVGNSGEGGGVFTNDEGAVVLNNSTVGRNYSQSGGGIRTDAGDVSLTNSTVSGNSSSGSGGGILTTSGDVSLDNSIVSANNSGGVGGGIRTGGGDVSLTNSTLNANSSNSSGGGVSTRFGDVSLTNSTASGNSSAGDGGGIHATDSDLTLTNSTVSGNISGADGGGVTAVRAQVLLVNSTLTGNSALGEGGGIYFDSNAQSLTLQNTIVAGNTADGTAPDVIADGSLVLVENSLIGDTTGSEITFPTGAGNILNELPLLGPLADNGGPTQTHALLSGSAAINAGSNLIAQANGLTSDQRGEARVRFGTVDIGAFESGLNERTLFVTTAQDVEDPNDGLTSLREAIASSNQDDSVASIKFASSVFDTPTTIDIASQLPSITSDLAITGRGANVLTIDAQGGGDGVLDGNGFRVFEVNDGDSNNSIDVSISGLTLTGGDASGSGGAVDNFENLNLDGVVVAGNRASFGGGVNNALSGVLTITNSTIAGNEAAIDGGGIFSRNELTAINVTISANSAVGNGSAIATAGDLSGATVNLTHTTLNSNIGGGIHFNSVNGSTFATFGNTIIDGSVTGVGVNGTALVGGFNLFTGADPGVIGTNNLFSQSAMLGPLLDNGGSTPTHSLIFGSPAINAGNNIFALGADGNSLTTDQRGQTRNQFGTVDIGAVETEFNEVRSLVVTTNLDVEDSGDGLTSLREAIVFANDPIAGVNFNGDADGDGLTSDLITFDASIFSGGDNNVIRLTQGELSVSDGLTIDGASVGSVLVTGDAGDDDVTVEGTDITNVSASIGGTEGAPDDLLDDNSRVLDFSADTGDLTLTNLTITGGQTQSNSETGGGINFRSSGTLTLNESTVRGNLAGRSGGGIFATEVNLTNSTVSENRTTGDRSLGGGISAVAVTLVNSTVSGNSTAGENSGGGGIAAIDNVTLINSTVSGNSNTGTGSFFGPFGNHGGGIYTRSGNVYLTNSTVSGNSSSYSGGGIASESGDVFLTNSTVSGNSSVGGGGGISAGNSTVLLINSTVAENSTLGIGGGISFQLGSFFSRERLTLHNSIVTGNTDNGTAPDVESVGDAVSDLTVEHSLIGDTTGSGITPLTGVGNVLNQSALLGPLLDNGGLTFTHALLPNSPAINAGNNALALDENGNPLSTDQLGGARIASGTVDIGAVEFEFVGSFLLGDANLDGEVNSLDIQPLISLLSSGTFLDEADIDRDGDVDFLDIGPFISLLSGSPTTPQPLLGDANLDGEANFLDIQPFISLLSNDTFLDEADIDRDGDVDFLDIGPFISLLSGSPTTPQPLLGDANLDGEANFLDIQPLISLLSSGTFLDEADINRDGNVNFLDTQPFISLLTSGEEAMTSQTFVTASPVSSVVPLVSDQEPLLTVVAVAETPIVIETSLAKDIIADPVVAGITLNSTNISLKAFAPFKYRFPGGRDSSRKGAEHNVPLAQQRPLVLTAQDLGFTDKSREEFATAHLPTEESFSTIADLFDAHPESLDEVFDF